MNVYLVSLTYDQIGGYDQSLKKQRSISKKINIAANNEDLAVQRVAMLIKKENSWVADETYIVIKKVKLLAENVLF